MVAAPLLGVSGPRPASEGSRLILRSGHALAVLRTLVNETGAQAVYWNRRYEPAITARDQVVKSELRNAGLTVESFNGSLLLEPWEVATKTGGPYQVFTPFWKACLARSVTTDPLPCPDKIPGPTRWPDSDKLADWKLLPTIPWDAGFHTAWSPSELVPPSCWSDFSRRRSQPIASRGTCPARRDVAALPASALWRDQPPPDLACGPSAISRSAARGRSDLPQRDRLAGVRVPHSVPLPDNPHEAATRRLRTVSLGDQCPAAAYMATRPHWVSNRRRRDARAVDHRLDA
ncbi:MAG: deoxyribodipyrimidine photo-lyase [Planctomycetaceae bacterium]